MSTPKCFFHANAPQLKLRRHQVLLMLSILLGGNILTSLAAYAASPTPGTVIENQATGSYVDAADNQTKTVESDIVRVTVAEVAGITVTSTGTTGINYPGLTVYFTYTITNVGNDPTQFFIPATATLTGNGTQAGNVQITGYSLDGVSLTTLSTPVVVPNGGGQTGRNSSGTAGLLQTPNPSGEFQPNGYITVRVPVLINAAATGGNIITVQLGDTPVDSSSTATPSARQQNIPFNNSNTVTNRVYTVDNANALGVTNEAAGNPINGDTTNRRQEASAIAQITVTALPTISGTVFEDVNYGGGAGRSLAASAGVGRGGATVELYDSTGTLRQTTVTSSAPATLGQYTFNAFPGSYTVRVVNSTVTSSRSGYVAGLLPVQTYRTDVATGTVSGVSDRVGGEKPDVSDASAGTLNTTTLASLTTSTTQAQSITAVTLGSANVGGIDFGYNFNAVVNPNHTGQGSLRQFINNANALTNTGLAQVGRTANIDNAIFMISNGSAAPGLRSALNYFSGGVATIQPTTNLTTITSPVIIDGTIQPGWSATPIVVIDGINAPSVVNTFGLTITGGGTTIRGLVLHRFFDDLINITGSGSNLIVGNYLGTSATGTTVPTRSPAGGGDGVDINSSNNVVGGLTAADRNIIAGYYDSGVQISGGTANQIIGNYIGTNVSGTAALVSGQNTEWVGIEVRNGTNTLIGGTNINARNIISGTVNGIYLTGGSGTTIQGNYIGLNAAGTAAIPNTEAGIGINATNNTIGGTATGAQNVIANNAQKGIVVLNGKLHNAIRQNSIYRNGGLGIDLGSDAVSANNGAVSGTLANNGLDYPLITSASLSSGTLTIKGFVGNNSAGSATFPSLIIEVFIADDDGDQNGEVVLGDGRSKPHGEGKTYLGSCTTDSNGLFGTASNPCSFANAGTLGLTNAANITATATDAAGNTSEFGTVLSQSKVLLVKRITAINGNRTQNPNDNTPLNTFVDDTTSIYQADDNDPGWPSGYLVGAIDGGKVKPGDELEYTIYFLNAGGSHAKKVMACDLLATNQSYQANSMNLYLGPTTGGTNYPLTDADDGSDRAQVIAAGSAIPSDCNGAATNTNSTPLVDVVGTTGSPNLPLLKASTSSGSPSDSFGYFRFKTKVNP